MKPNATPRPTDPREHAAEELKTAYEIHTLVHLLTARLAGAQPWVPPIQAPYPPLLH